MSSTLNRCRKQSSRFAQFLNCAVQIRNCVIANQSRNCAATFEHVWKCAGTHHQPVFYLAGRQSTPFKAEARTTGELKCTCFQPELWATVSILSWCTIFCPLSFEILLLVSTGTVFFAEHFKTLALINRCLCLLCTLSLLQLCGGRGFTTRNHNFVWWKLTFAWFSMLSQ